MFNNETNKLVIPQHFKQLICQAKNCIYFKYPATCTADYLEMDDRGVCRQLEMKKIAAERKQ